MPGTPEEFGLSLVILSLVFACAALLRRWSRPLRALFIPTAVIGGFLVLGLGPEGVGRLTGGYGVFSTETFAVWNALPGLLINVMCASLLLGERLPPLKSIWTISGSHVIIAGIMSAGQFAIGGILVLLLLEPLFGFSSKGGALIEMAFAGGHGTLAGLTPVLVEYGAEELLEVGLGLATIGMVTGIVVGTMLVNYAINSPSIPVARQNPTSADEDLDIDHHLPSPDDQPMSEWRGMTRSPQRRCFSASRSPSVWPCWKYSVGRSISSARTSSTSFRCSRSRSSAASSSSWLPSGSTSSGRSTADPWKGSVELRSTASSSAPSARCR